MKAGEKLGTVQVWYGEKCLAQTDMVAMNDVPLAQTPSIPEKPGFIESGEGLSLLFKVLIIGVIAAILVVGGQLGIRALRIVLAERRRKRRARRRR